MKIHRKRHQIRTTLIKVLGLCVVCLLGTRGAYSQEVIEQIQAHVGSDVVLYSDVQKRLSQMEKMPQFAKLTPVEKETICLDSLIDERLVSQEVRRLNIDVSDKEIDGVVERMQAQNRMDAFQFEQALMSQGMNLKQYRKQIKKQLIKMRLVQTKVKNQVQIPEEDIRALYLERHRLEADSYDIRASHILVKLAPGGSDSEEASAQAKIAEIKEALQTLSFAQAAKKYSEGPSSVNGGALGVFGRGKMVPAFEAAAFAAPVGEVVGPVRTAFGYHLIQVQEHVAAQTVDYETAKPALRQELTEREMERLFGNYIKGLRARAWIQKNPSAVK